MNCDITVALVGLIGILVGVLLGNWMALGRDDRTRRIEFIGRISELKAAANKIDDHQFSTWFANMQVSVEKECAIVESAIKRRRSKRFADARKKCSKPQIQDDIADPETYPRQLPVGMDRLPPLTYQAGRMLVAGIADDLIEAAR